MTDYEKNIRMELWDKLNSGEISEEEWGLWMWANGQMPDDYIANEDDFSGWVQPIQFFIKNNYTQTILRFRFKIYTQTISVIVII